MNIKTLFTKYEAANERANKADEAWGNAPEDETLEKEFDEAYSAEFNAREELVNEIVKLTSGKIDAHTARKMINAKREELKALIERIA